MPQRRSPDLLLTAGILAVAGVMVRAIWFTPVELRQGLAQKIFYVHVPSAFIALYVGFGLLAVASGLYLWLRDPRLDRLAESAAEVGLVFMTAVLVTGPIWGKPIWGTWWTWDARLTSTLFLWFIVLGYLLLRGAIEDPGTRATYSAVLGILSLLLVPFIHLSVYLYRTLHPMPIVLKPSAPSLPGAMLVTLLASLGAFLLLFLGLLRARYRYALERDLVRAAESLAEVSR
ncbi:MAG TPA: cytochrome c biogenesis protein CcsA [Gemmatimonadaceae bacterium]|nr:cytochrome c biogenesis protein CcsA [Gemmatimonadaceae bacterium]